MLLIHYYLDRQNTGICLINVTKRFITNGGVADISLAFAMTDKSKRAHGQSVFIVTPDMPGFSIGKIEDKMGQRASRNSEVIFEEARVPKENLLGKEGGAFSNRPAWLRACSCNLLRGCGCCVEGSFFVIISKISVS